MGKIIKDGVEYDFGTDIIYHLIGSGDAGGSSEGDSESNSGIKVVELGALGETFDLTQYEGYENFTLDNFYVQVDSASSKAGTTGINYWTDSRGRTAYIAKSEITGGSASLSELLSYDASTGQLTTKKTGSGSVTMQSTSNQDSYDKKSASASLSLTVEGTVYLIQATESDGSGESSGGIGGNANTVLLWSQPAAGDGTKFNAQTLSLPEIANYEGVAIKCCLCNNSGNGYVNEIMTYYFEKGTSMRVGMRASYDAVSMATVYRVIEVTEDSVIFNDAYNTSTADGRYIYPMEIYGYTTAEIENNGNVVEEEKVLLWENTKPTSSFAAQDTTLSESANNFDWLEIHAWDSYGTYQDIKYIYRYSIDQLTEVGELYGSNTHGLMVKDSYSNIYTRPFVLKDGTTLTWGVGYMLNSTTTDNARAIPYQIYGVKNGMVLKNGETLIDYIVTNYQTSYNKTLYSYTVKEAGKYRFAGTVSNTGSVSGGGYFKIRKNSAVMYDVTCGSAVGNSVDFDYTMECEVGDVIDFTEVHQGSGYSYFKMNFFLTSTASIQTETNKSAKFTKSVTVGSSIVSSISIDISQDYPDYKNITIDDMVIYHRSNQLTAVSSSSANQAGIPIIKYTYDPATGIIVASVGKNAVFTGVYFYMGWTYTFDVAIVRS